MLGRLRAGFRPEDGWLALGFVVAAGLEAVIRYHADRAALISNLIGALTFTVLALRRSRPLLTVSVMSVIFSAASFVQAALLPDESGDALVPIFALLVVSYSLGAYATRRQLRWGAWQPVLLVLVVDVSAPSANSLTSAALFITLFVSAAPIVAGRLVRGRRMLVRRLREQAAQIEAHRRVQVEAAVVAERLRMVQRFHETLVIGMQSLATRAAGAEASSGERAIGEVEREARALLSQTREEVVGLTAAIPDAGAATHRPQLARFGDAAQPWSVLAGGALCTGLLVETRTLPLHVPQPLAWLACVVLAVPLVFAWRRPLLAICTLWTLAALFDAFVAPLDGSFTAIGLSFVPAFTIAALEPRRRALIGLAACLLGELACFGPHGLASNGAVVLVCWIGGSILYERARLAEQLRVNNSVLDEQRAAAARKAVADERLRAARELHDAVGHSLTVVTLQAGAARRLCISDPARAHSVLRTIATVARDGLLELRHGAASADPGHVADSRSVDDLLATARAAGLHIDAHVEDVAALLGPDAQFAMYRVVQEALTNILKHAPGATAQLRIQRSRECIEIVVHNSAPAAPAPPSTGERHGLRGMRARIDACGGRISWSPHADGGFEVRAELPAAVAAL